MAKEKQNRLSIYLLKNVKNLSEAIRDDKKLDYKIIPLITYSPDKIAYYAKSKIDQPDWLDFFVDTKDTKKKIKEYKDSLSQATAKAVLIVRCNCADGNKVFAITFGFGRYLLDDSKIERNFGLQIVLNSVKSNALRKILRRKIGGNHKQVMEQLVAEGDISEFDFDIDTDVIKSVTGKAQDKSQEDKNLLSGMLYGADSVNVLSACNIDNVEILLRECYKHYKYKDDEKAPCKENFPWAYRMQPLNDKKEIGRLDGKLLKRLKAKKFDGLYFNPTITADICEYTDGNNNSIDDILSFCKYCIKSDTDTENFYKIKILDNNNDNAKEISAYKCLEAEINERNYVYVLSDGIWYKVNNNNVVIINNYYDNIPLSEEIFPKFKVGAEKNTEGKYNKDLANAKHWIYADTHLVYSKTRGYRIELCDVLHDKELIHIKRNHGAQSLSHLSEQGRLSAKMLLDQTFRRDCNRKFKFKKFEEDFKFPTHDYTITFAIITKDKVKNNKSRPDIPFFGRASLVSAAREIENLGYNVQIAHIEIKYEK